ncbi:MAG: adenylate/guanylate cyclase domain-containing protein [Bermanella sp.]
MTDYSEQKLKLDSALLTLEAQRAVLGDEAVDIALKGVRLQLVELQNQSLSAPQSEGERRQATIAFSDLSGYTAMSEKLDPEEVQKLMSEIKTGAIRIMESHGGIVNQFIGDEVVSLFGIPTASKDDPIRAVRAVFELHNFVAEMSAAVEKKFGLTLRLHTGINTGLIVTHLEDNRDGRYGLTGNTVNIGARLLSQAKAGDILVSPETRQLVSGNFETAALAAVEMKGKSKPIIPYRVVKELNTPVKALLSFVGRQSELQQFTRLLNVIRDTGKGQAILVRGDAGIGKTRLIKEFESMATSYDFARHKGMILDFGAGKSREAIHMIVNSLLKIKSKSNEATCRSTAERAICEGLLNPEHNLFLYDLMDLTLPAKLQSLYESMDNETRNAGKQKTLGELLKKVSIAQPALVIIEDTHWADSQTLPYLAELTEVVADNPSLLVMTSRIEGDQLDQAWQAHLHGGSLLVMNMTPFKKEEALDLASEFDEITMQVVTKCIERAEGNPLFLEQLLLSAEENKGELVPGLLQSIVLSRLDRLEPTDKLAVQAASIIGQHFSLQLLRHLIGNQQYTCNRLIENQLVRTEDNDYLFVHALVREGVYASLLKSTGRKLHQTAALWFAPKDLELCAEHYRCAEDKRAPKAYLNAAQAQVSKYNYARALNLVEQGLKLLLREDSEATVKAELMCCKGQILLEMGDNEQSVKIFNKALTLCSEEAEQVRAMLGMVGGMRVLGQYEEGIKVLEQAETKALNKRLSKELAKIYHMRGNLCFPLGKIDGVLKYHNLALQYAQQASSIELEANALGGLGDAYYVSGRMKTANKHFHQCVEISRQNGFSRIEAANLSMVGWSYFFLNEFESALQAGAEAVRVAQKISHYRAEIVAHHIIAEVNYNLGNFTVSKDEYKKASNLESIIKTNIFEAQRFHKLGLIAYNEGDHSLAMSLLEQAEDSCRNHGMEFAGPAILGGIAEVTKDPVRRKNALLEAEALLEKGARHQTYFIFYRHAIDACLNNGEWKSAGRYADELESFTNPEPLPWSDFFIKRGRVLAAYGRGQRDEKIQQEIKALHGQAVRVGMNLVIPALEQMMVP